MDRTKAALEGLPGVEKVHFAQEPEGDIFTLHYHRTSQLTLDEVREAVLGKVVAPGARAGLEKVGQLTGMAAPQRNNR